MLILGIDPGLNTTGYGLIETKNNCFTLKEAGFVRTSPKLSLPERLNRIHKELSAILDKHKPEAMVLEKLYAHYKHPVTAALLGHARGVICMLAEEKKIQFFEYAATNVKKMTTGSGHASKEQIQKMIEYTFGAKREAYGPVDTTDAISLAMTHAYSIRTRI
ncbi:MAG TPA: crossover junction endodeoxyribonuclease RuvC [Candidatus Omnitrophota bacterium]|nr:crossover junction endodeoxyribonuclease RuvC [Candidatus Omnitrophota bacterium]